MKKAENTKKKGFALIMAILMVVLISSAIFSVTMLNISNSNDVVKDVHKNKAYYIANAGLEMFYSALSTKVGSGLEITGNRGTKDIITKSDNYVIPIKNMGTAKDMGTATLEVQLQKVDGKYVYRVYSTGKVSNAGNNVKDTHILTMFIKKDDINNPTIYDGIKENIE